jgi:hypothetical protein
MDNARVPCVIPSNIDIPAIVGCILTTKVKEYQKGINQINSSYN